MAQYRIKKGGREFTATRVETLKELLRRGLLHAADGVSVDGGDYRPLSELAELKEAFAEQSASGLDSESSAGRDVEGFLSIPQGIAESDDDPWRHWSNFESDEDEEGDGPSEEGVLASFLGQVELTESGTFPALRRSQPSMPSLPAFSPPTSSADDEESGGAEDVSPAGVGTEVRKEAPTRLDPVALDGSELEPVEPTEPLPSSSSHSSSGVERSPPSPSVSAEEEEERRTEELLKNPDLPVSFKAWLEQNQSGVAGGERLERFGRYDDGIVQSSVPKPGGFNLFGVLFVVLVGCLVIGSAYFYFHTSAQSPFPMESELETRVPGAVGLRKPSNQLTTMDSPAGSAALQLPPENLERRAREKMVRQKIRSSIIDFTSAETLEDALFQELTNAGSKPMSVTVEPLGRKGSSDKYNRRPTKANLTIELRKISVEGDAGYEVLEERLIHSWLLAGKYSTLGRLQFEKVEVIIAPPLAWSQTYLGRDLGLLWEQQLNAADLFPEE